MLINRQNANHGFALIFTLWVLAIFSVILLTFTLYVDLNITSTKYIRDNMIACDLANGAISKIIPQLILPKKYRQEQGASDTTSINDQIVPPIQGAPSPEGNVEQQSQAAQSSQQKIEQRRLAVEKIKWYHDQLGKWYIDKKTWNLSRKQPNDDINNYIICQISTEDSKFPLNSISKIEKSFFLNTGLLEQIKTTYNSLKKTGGFSCIEQLLKIKEIRGKIYDGYRSDGLKEIMTTYSDGKIDINSVGGNVLELIPNVTENATTAISAQIQAGEYITKTDDLNNIQAISGDAANKLKQWIKFSPEYFRIKAYTKVNAIYGYSECVVKISNTTVKFLYLNRG